MIGVVVNSLILAFTLKGSESIIYKEAPGGGNKYEPLVSLSVSLSSS